MDSIGIEQKINQLSAATGRLRILCVVQSLLLFAFVAYSFGTRSVKAESSSTVLRARGLVIEDSEGRPRVLLGSPFPATKGRARQDAPTEAMIFLDELGHDRLTLGEAPDPQVDGKVLHRIARHFGVVIHDKVGDERGAYGYLANGRVVVTLDRPGHEAWAAIVNDKTGLAGMSLLFPPGLGKGDDAIQIGTQDTGAYFRFLDSKQTTRASLEIGKEDSFSFRLFDQAGRQTHNLLQQPAIK